MRRAPLTIRLSLDERAALDAYAKRKGLSAAGGLRMLILEMIEDAADLRRARKSFRQFKKHPESAISSESVKRRFGISTRPAGKAKAPAAKKTAARAAAKKVGRK